MEPFHHASQSQAQNGQTPFPFQLMYQPDFTSSPTSLQPELQSYMVQASSPVLSEANDQLQLYSQFSLMEPQCQPLRQVPYQPQPQAAQSQPQPIKKGPPNKIWKPHYDDFLIAFLVEQVNQGMKIDKTFKKQAFEAAATAVNHRFDESFTWENVENHMRTLKTKYQEIKKYRDFWGAGWNEDLKMITLDKSTYETYIEANPKAKDYINKPINNYEALKSICGDEQAMGYYKKSIFQQFGTRQPAIGSKTRDSSSGKGLVSLDGEMEEATVGVKHTKRKRRVAVHPQKPTQSSIIEDTTSSSVGRKCRASTKKPRENVQTTIMKLAQRVDYVANAMGSACPADWTSELHDKIMELDDFGITVQDAAFDKLRGDETEARAFIVKNMAMRISWMKRFMAEHFSVE